MLAHHPETGQPIRILRSEAQITQSRRTLVWLQEGYSQTPRWQRWHVLLSDPSMAYDAITPTALIVHEFSEAWIPILKAADCLVVYHRRCEGALKRAGLPVENYLVYTDLFQMYPFLGEPVLPTDPLEKVVVSVAHILRFQHLAWTPSSTSLENDGVKAQLHAWRQTCGGKPQILPATAVAEEVVPACWLIQQYFKHSMPRRAKEIATCLEKNLANPYIDKVLLLNERSDFTLPTSEKLIVRCIDRRLTYYDVLEAIRTDLPTGAFAIFANSDIWCDESLQVLWSIPLAERRLFLALLRWEDKEEPVLFGPRSDSQDTWIVAKETVDFTITEEEFGFPFGKPGCDNAIALAMLKKRCLVVNPAHSIKTWHLHTSNIRDYNPRDILYKPAYLYLDPTPIQLFSIEDHMKTYETLGNVWRAIQPRASFPRMLHTVNEGNAKTVCRMLGDRGEEWGMGANLWTPPADARPLYEFKNTFVSDTGLLSNFQAIFVGQHAAWRDGWRDSTLSSVTTTIHVPAMISVTVGPDCWKSLAAWCIQYLPTVLRIRKLAGCEYEFLVPTISETPPFLYDCVWRDTHVGTVPHIANTQYYCNRLLAPAPGSPLITKEDVTLLRELLPVHKGAGTAASTAASTMVICLEEGDDAVFHEGWFEEWRTCHAVLLRRHQVIAIRPTDSHKMRRESFQAADWIFGRRESLQWIWMAKPGTKVVEWMLETEISSEILHIAGAAECKYILSLVRKEPVEYQRQNALLEFAKIWAEYAFPEIVASTIKEKPMIVVPSEKARAGIWSMGTLREMVAIWAERGYCEMREADTPYTWWGDVGQTMLFEYSSARWWDPTKTTYQLALWGKCSPAGPAGHEMRQSVWSYWSRYPRALESLVAEGRLNWSERPISSVFCGKVENGIQKAVRNGADWASVIEAFSMPEDTTGEAYPYTTTEYLDKLRHSRFGLCLPGVGTKTHRDIEYMALGVVPIVTPGMDMSGYLVPPREGVHFFRAADPAAVRSIVAETTPEKWEAMSAACHTWWRQNASAEGLFRLTWGRIEQCRPLQGLLIPAWPDHYRTFRTERIGNL